MTISLVFVSEIFLTLNRPAKFEYESQIDFPLSPRLQPHSATRWPLKPKTFIRARTAFVQMYITTYGEGPTLQKNVLVRKQKDNERYPPDQLK